MEIKCDKCGATLQYSPGTQDLVCEYCGHAVKIGYQPDPDADVKADDILPIKVDKDQAIACARVYMTMGVTTPDDLVKEAEIKEVKMFYFPVYYIRGEYIAHWTASFGYDRKEYYHEWDSVLKKNVQRYRTVTDWAPQSGTVQGDFCYKCYGLDLKSLNLADDATSAIDHVLANIDANGTVNYDTQYMTGCAVVPYSYSSNEAWSSYGAGRLSNSIDVNVRSNAQGDRQRDWRWNDKVTFNSCERTYLPIVQVEFVYKEQSYYCYIDGSNPRNMDGTTLPVDEKKKNLEETAETAKKLAVLPLVAVGVAWAILAFLTEYRVAVQAFGVGIVGAIIYQFSIKKFINSELKKVHDYSEKLRECLLVQQQVQDGKMDPGTEAVAESFNLPEPVTHKISTMLVPTLIAAVLAAGLPVGYSVSELGKVASSHAQTQRSQSQPQSQPQQAQRTQSENAFDVFNRLVVQHSIAANSQSINDVLRQLDALPKPNVGNPQAIVEHLPKVETYFATQDYANAATLLKQLADVSPADTNLRGNLAYAYYKLQKYNDSASHAAMAVMSDPTHVSAWKVLKASCNKLDMPTCVKNSDLVIKFLQ